EPLPHQVGQVAAVVDVRVAEDDRGDLLRGEGEVEVALPRFGAAPLVEAAVQQHLLAAHMDKVHRAGDGARGTPEGDGRRSDWRAHAGRCIPPRRRVPCFHTPRLHKAEGDSIRSRSLDPVRATRYLIW